jgi:Na+/H+-dicarboxylate symporter
MCSNKTISKFISNPFMLYLTMIVLGVLSGMSDISLLKTLGQLISEIFIKIFKCISLPIIALSIIVTIATLMSEQSAKKIWQRTLIYTLSTTVVAAIVSCVLYLLIQPKNVEVVSQKQDALLTNNVTYFQHLSNLIPDNIFSPFLEHQVMGVLLVGIVLGLAIRQIPEKNAQETTINFFKGLHAIFMMITKAVIKVIPLALYGFVVTTVIQMRTGINVAGIAQYLTTVVLANVIQGFLILPLWLRANGIQPFVTMRKAMPALSLAFFSKSSAGTLPVTMSTAENKLNISPKVSRFVLPLCTSINMNGCAAFIFTTVIYLMQNHGMPITLSTMAIWIVIATIAAVGNAGVPMGCFFLSASLLASMNVPITLLGIILPFYSIIDMIETSLNVWSDTCVATVVSKHDNA